MKTESKIALVAFISLVILSLAYGCYKEYVDIQYKRAIIELSNK